MRRRAFVQSGPLTGSQTSTTLGGVFEVVALGLATVLASIILLDGETNWFEGFQLLADDLQGGADDGIVA